MAEAVIVLDPAFVVGKTDPRLFGSFVEHLGRCVYGGIFEPGHPTADDEGFRQDVLELVRELGVTVIRYPGGNFVSGYNWEDGVGPLDKRPRRRELAWFSTETNAFGTNEFMAWCAKASMEPMMAVNLGTRGADEARALLEYCNVESGTALSDLRHEHGHPAPHNIRLWCLGNEMDAPWQIGAKTAQEYGALARESAKLMRWLDPNIELVACGSSSRSMPTFAEWERVVLEETFDVVEYISLHGYFSKHGDRSRDFMAEADLVGRYIDEIVAVADGVAARRRSPKRIMLSFDEWNVWYRTRDRATRTKPGWPEAPAILEEIYTMEDALVFGSRPPDADQPMQSGKGRVRGSTRQRHRAYHDRDRRAGVAAADLLSVPACGPLGAGNGPRHAPDLRDLRGKRWRTIPRYRQLCRTGRGRQEPCPFLRQPEFRPSDRCRDQPARFRI